MTMTFAAKSSSDTEPMLQIKRVYDPPATKDGYRVLIDRLWPRGLKREAAHIDLWLKDIAPSDELRRWFGHDPKRWKAFAARYREELAAQEPIWQELARRTRKRRVTLLFAAKDAERNNAVVLKSFLAGK